MPESGSPPNYYFAPEEATPGNDVRILCDGPEIFPALLNAISSAKEKVALEFYLFAPDRIGREVLERLCEAARRGCDVRVIYDAIGSMWTPENFFFPLTQAGGEVVMHRPIAPWRRNWGWLKRDHRKMLLVDDDLAMIGGINISDEYVRPPAEGGYHDLAVEVRGPACGEAWKLFESAWKLFARSTFLARLRKPWVWKKGPSSTGTVEFIGNDFLLDRWRIRRAILYAIKQAEHSVDIVNPYFLPDGGVRSALRDAKKRGVRVRAVIPRRSDVPVVDLASLRAQYKLLRRGVEVLAWPGMVHAKAIVVDGRWFSIGTYNFDHMSLFHNLEVMVNVLDDGAAKRLTEIFDSDAAISMPFTIERWHALPLWKKVASHVFYRLRSFL